MILTRLEAVTSFQLHNIFEMALELEILGRKIYPKRQFTESLGKSMEVEWRYKTQFRLQYSLNPSMFLSNQIQAAEAAKSPFMPVTLSSSGSVSAPESLPVQSRKTRKLINEFEIKPLMCKVEVSASLCREFAKFAYADMTGIDGSIFALTVERVLSVLRSQEEGKLSRTEIRLKELCEAAQNQGYAKLMITAKPH